MQALRATRPYQIINIRTGKTLFEGDWYDCDVYQIEHYLEYPPMEGAIYHGLVKEVVR
jgi:hypothetical protein